MEAHANADGSALRPIVRGVRALRVDSGRDRFACPREREEERIALGVDLDPVRRHERLADDPSVVCEGAGVAASELLQELR